MDKGGGWTVDGFGGGRGGETAEEVPDETDTGTGNCFFMVGGAGGGLADRGEEFEGSVPSELARNERDDRSLLS